MSETVFNDPLFDDPAEIPATELTAAEPIFEEAAPVAVSAPPGPGLPEALVWTIGTLIVHVIGSLAVLMSILFEEASQRKLPPEEIAKLAQDPGFLEELKETRMLDLLAGEQVVFLICVLLFGWLRLRKQGVRSLPLRQPAWTHVGLSALWFLPLAVTCGQLAAYLTLGWEQLVEAFPGLKLFDTETSMEMIQGLTKSATFPQLLLWIAVLPAIAEEIVFRGVVGRGLVARYGMWVGIGITSLLFGIVHMNPVHALALLPLAVAMHFAYIATRSFWIPMLIHFLNNAFAVLMMFAGEQMEIGDEAAAVAPSELPLLPWYVILAAVVCCLAIGRVIWQTRIEFMKGEDEVWTRPYVTADAPQATETFQPQKRRTTIISIVLCAVAYVVFLGVLVASGQAAAQ